MAVAQRGKVKLKSAPYDSFILSKGRFIAVELKSQKIFGSFPLSNIQLHQIDGLQEVVDLECASYFLFNQRRLEKDGKSKSKNRAWYVDFSKWKDLLSEIGDRKSIPAAMFDNSKYLVEIPRTHVLTKVGKELVWDIRVLVP